MGKTMGRNQRKDTENDETIMTECARSAVMLDEGISKYVHTLQGVAQGCTLPPNLFKIDINDLILIRCRSGKAGTHGRGKYGVGIDVRG